MISFGHRIGDERDDRTVATPRLAKVVGHSAEHAPVHIHREK
jgi:hypothetical protein